MTNLPLTKIGKGGPQGRRPPIIRFLACREGLPFIPMLFLLKANFSIGVLHRHRLNTPANLFQTNNDGVIRRNRDIFSASHVKRIIAVKGQVPIVIDTVELVVLEDSVNAQFKKA